MTAKSDEVQRAKWSLIQHAFDEICNVPNYSNFRSKIFCVIANLGLQMKVKEEGLLVGEEWYNPDCRDELLEKVKDFLLNHIK